ncbi:MAG: MarR family transcriptional regulator [Propionibacteriaceae bacterium]|nr:MarR family transcriptional regulator [Propionibacteriaceae bacterium]
MTESPWLTTEQQRIWRDYLQATFQLSSFLEAGLRPYGLSLAEYEVLVGLSEAPGGRLRMSELAAFAHLSRSRLTHTVTRMERSGLVTRTACTADGRGVVAAVTEEGLALIEQAARGHVAAVRTALVDAADEADFAAFGRVMAAVIDATGRGQRARTES